MKYSLLFIACLIAAGLWTGPAFAKPEQVEIKSHRQKDLERLAHRDAANVNFSNIADPETRKALRAVFAALDLKSKDALKSAG